MASPEQGSEEEMRIDPARAKELGAALSRIRSAMGAAANSSSSSSSSSSGGRAVRLVAVSKLKPASDILALVQGGRGGRGEGDGQQQQQQFKPQLHFGENYVQELMHKAAVLPHSIRWHFIGGLQSNKCRPLAAEVGNLWCVASVDSAKKANGLDRGRAAWLEGSSGNKDESSLDKKEEEEKGQDGKEDGKDDDDDDDSATTTGPLRVYVQVNTSGEASKSGTEPGADTAALCRHIRDSCPHLRLAGLMTIGAIARSQAAAEGEENDDFVALAAEREAVARDLGIPAADLQLSMGMSADFEAAIRAGSDEVRVGSQIFGARPPKQSRDAKAEAEEDKS